MYTPPYKEDVALAELYVDERYQRDLDKPRIEKWLKQGYNEAAFHPLICNLRNDHKRYVLDGQHRREFARRLGLVTVPCFTHVGLSPHEEAEAFTISNVATKKPTAMNLFKTRLFKDEPFAHQIKNAVEAEGFRIGDDDSSRSIRAVDAIEGLFGISGESGLRSTLRLWNDLWPNVQMITDLMRGLFWLYYNHIPGDVSRADVARKLGFTTPQILRQKALNLRAVSKIGPNEAMYRVMVDEVNRGKTKNRLKYRTISAKGGDASGAKLDPGLITEIRELYNKGEWPSTIAKKYGLSWSGVAKIVSEKSWPIPPRKEEEVVSK